MPPGLSNPKLKRRVRALRSVQLANAEFYQDFRGGAATTQLISAGAALTIGEASGVRRSSAISAVLAGPVSAYRAPKYRHISISVI